MPLDTEIAWCAGFFDGEGHVSYQRTYPTGLHGHVSAQLMCSIAQAATNTEVLEEFCRITELGRILGPYKMPNGKPQYRLIFGVREVEPLFELLKPYLRKEKTSDFQYALLAYERHDPNASAEDYARLTRKQEKKRNKLR